MEDQDLQSALPQDAENGMTSPAQRYQQLREAVLNH